MQNKRLAIFYEDKMPGIFRSIYCYFYFRQFDAESLINALDILNQVDPERAKTPPSEIERAKRVILRELMRRKNVEFDVYIK